LNDSSSFIIPTFYTRQLREVDTADAQAYHISANFAHRAMVFQQLVVNKFQDHVDREFDRAAQRNPTAAQDLIVGQCVLIDWHGNGNGPPYQTLPLKRGPYRVEAVHRNTVELVHVSVPPPPNQPQRTVWSKHAHIYCFPEDSAPLRSAFDPAASQSPAGTTGRRIDCIISHQLKPSIDRSQDPQLLRHRVESQLYECRLYGTDLKPKDLPSLHRTFEYHQIQHTYAFDVYAQAHRYLTGHVPVAHMPANWSPHAVVRSRQPSHPAVPIHELLFPDSQQRLDGNASDT
jgi:hypothetical protein